MEVDIRFNLNHFYCFFYRLTLEVFFKCNTYTEIVCLQAIYMRFDTPDMQNRIPNMK